MSHGTIHAWVPFGIAASGSRVGLCLDLLYNTTDLHCGQQAPLHVHTNRIQHPELNCLQFLNIARAGLSLEHIIVNRNTDMVRKAESHD